LSRSSAVSSIRNAIGVIKEVVAFFNESTKRNYVWNKVLKAQLKGMLRMVLGSTVIHINGHGL